MVHFQPSLRSIRQRGFTLVEILVAISTIGILLAMLIPAIQTVRESSRRTHCLNNVRQLAIACITHESAKGRFPHGCVLGQGAAWSAFILNEIEQPGLADEVDLSDKSSAPSGTGNAINWTSDPNERVCATFIPTFRCPIDPVPQHIDSGSGPLMARRVPSSYIGVASGTTKSNADMYWSGTKTKAFVNQARSGVLVPSQHAEYFGAYKWKSEISYNDILDGTSNTLLVGETVFDTDQFEGTSKGIDHWYIGSYQVDYNIEMSEFLGSTAIPLNWYHRFSDQALKDLGSGARASRFSEMAFGFASWHADDGVNFSFTDGSMRFISSEIDETVFANLGNRADREAIPEF